MNLKCFIVLKVHEFVSIGTNKPDKFQSKFFQPRDSRIKIPVLKPYPTIPRQFLQQRFQDNYDIQHQPTKIFNYILFSSFHWSIHYVGAQQFFLCYCFVLSQLRAIIYHLYRVTWTAGTEVITIWASPKEAHQALEVRSCIPQTKFAGTAMSIIFGYDRFKSVSEKICPSC